MLYGQRQPPQLGRQAACIKGCTLLALAPYQPSLWVLGVEFVIDGRPDPDGAALVEYRHQADGCAKRWMLLCKIAGRWSLVISRQALSANNRHPHTSRKSASHLATKRTSAHLVFQIQLLNSTFSPRA
jgi:hypothetical protein